MFHVPPQIPSITNARSRLYLPGRTHVLIPYLTRALSPREDPGLVPIEEIVFVDARLRAEDRRKQQFYCPNCNDEVYDTWVFNNHPETVAVPSSQPASHSGSHLSASQATSEPVNQSVLPIRQPASQSASQPAIWAASQAIWLDARDEVVRHFHSSELCARRRPPPRV